VRILRGGHVPVSERRGDELRPVRPRPLRERPREQGLLCVLAGLLCGRRVQPLVRGLRCGPVLRRGRCKLLSVRSGVVLDQSVG